jgi:hypothetical protein
MDEPLSRPAARTLIRKILLEGEVTFSAHSLDEMAKDGLERTDCLNVLRGGVVEFEELVGGTWRYRLRTPRITVVIAFRSEEELRVVTAWRNKI